MNETDFENLVFENHDLRQRLMLAQESLIEAKRELNQLAEAAGKSELLQQDLDEKSATAEQLQQRVDELAEWSASLSEENQRIKQEKIELWEWAEPQLAELEKLRAGGTIVSPTASSADANGAAEYDLGGMPG